MMNTGMVIAVEPAGPDTQRQWLRTDVAASEALRASTALRDLVRARTRLHRLQREVVLGRGDDELLDDAVAAYRLARARAGRWLNTEKPGRPRADELFASWLIEAAVQANGQAAPAAHA